MCIVALAHRELDDSPLAIAANREEAYSRQGSVPELWEEPRIAAGRDPVAGGTWLGVSASGLAVAVTNRSFASGARSRGALCVDLLREGEADRASALARKELSTGTYGGCNALVADGRTAWVVHGEGAEARVVRLWPGVHLLARGDVDDEDDPRQARVRRAVESASPATADDWLRLTPSLLGLHAGDDGPAVCLHHGSGGTVSSDAIALEPGGRATWLHAQGPPCTTPFEDHSGPLRAALGD